MLTIVNDTWDASRGGREQYAADLVAYLSAQGQIVKTATSVVASPANGLPILSLSPWPGATHYQLHSGVLAEAFDAERQSMASPLRRALYRPALSFNRRRQRLLDREASVLRGTTRLMVFSDATRRALITQHDIDASRIVVSRPGVDLGRFHPPDEAADRRVANASLRLLFVGHNLALKGLRTAIAALGVARTAGVDASITVVGRGPIGRYARQAATARVADRVRFAGAKDADAVADLYRASNALIHPTFYDPFPRVIIEALACGCPVITTTRCGAAEILTNRQDALLVDDPLDITGVAGAIGTLADVKTLMRMRAAAATLGKRFDQVAHFRDTSRWLCNRAVAG